jgi:ABC-2 type transport system ATP-binding protein
MKITIFLNSHDLDEVQRICTKIAIIQRGSIKVCDKLENLRGKSTSTAVQVTLSDSSNAGKACELLSTLSYVSKLSQSDAAVVATLAEGNKPSGSLAFLVEKGIKVEEIRTITQSLEDIYLEITHQEEGHE